MVIHFYCKKEGHFKKECKKFTEKAGPVSKKVSAAIQCQETSKMVEQQRRWEAESTIEGVNSDVNKETFKTNSHREQTRILNTDFHRMVVLVKNFTWLTAC